MQKAVPTAVSVDVAKFDGLCTRLRMQVWMLTRCTRPAKDARYRREDIFDSLMLRALEHECGISVMCDEQYKTSLTGVLKAEISGNA